MAAVSETEHILPALTATPLAPFITSRTDDYDGLRLVRTSFVPEIRLYLADDATVFQARLEDRFGPVLNPFWTNAWAGGQALARFVLDHPEVVAGRSVLDVASGCGLSAIAAARVGAASVTANDIDPNALAAVAMNAEANAVTVGLNQDELLDGDGGDADVILIGDGFYHPALAERMRGFLRRAAARGAYFLVGDPDRGHLPGRQLRVLTTYRVYGLGAAEDTQLTEVSVLGPAAVG